MRGTTLNASVTFVVEDCCECGMAFAMTQEFKNRKLEDKTMFYCPSGHRQHYLGKTEAQKLREQLERTEIQRDHARAEAERAEARARKAEAEAAAEGA